MRTERKRENKTNVETTEELQAIELIIIYSISTSIRVRRQSVGSLPDDGKLGKGRANDRKRAREGNILISLFIFFGSFGGLLQLQRFGL